MLSTLPPRIFRSIQPPQKLSYLKYKRPMVPLHSELANYGVGDLSRISWLGVHQRGGVYKAGTGCLNPERCTLSIGRCLHPRWSRQCTLPRAEGPTSSRALHSKSLTPQLLTGAAGASRGGVRAEGAPSPRALPLVGPAARDMGCRTGAEPLNSKPRTPNHK